MNLSEMIDSLCIDAKRINGVIDEILIDCAEVKNILKTTKELVDRIPEWHGDK